MDSMDEHLLEVLEYRGAGYRPLVDFESWRVAVLRKCPGMDPASTTRVERHTETDEVFVLLLGRAMLIIAGDDSSAGSMVGLTMQKGKIYNVKRNTWHAALLSRGGSILIIENRNTGETNTEFCLLTAAQRQAILEMDFSS